MSKFGWAKLGVLILLIGVMATVVAVNESGVLDAETTKGGYSGANSNGLTGSEPASAPSKMNVPGWGYDSPTFSPQYGPIGSGLSMSVIHSIPVSADNAYIVIIPAQIYGNSGYPIAMSEENRAAVIARLVEIGIAKEAIEFEYQQYNSSSISVAVPVGQLPQIGEQILDAIEGVLGRSEHYGVRFGLTPGKCEQALIQVRRQAVARANESAGGLAQALGIQQGGITAAAEYPFDYYGSTSSEGCGNEFVDPYSVEPFDADPEVDVSLNVQVVYAIEPVAEPPAQP
jgi:hypothetical protein